MIFTSIDVSARISFFYKKCLRFIVKMSDKFTVRDPKSKEIIGMNQVEVAPGIVLQWFRKFISYREEHPEENKANVLVNGLFKNFSFLYSSFKKFLLVHKPDEIVFVEFSKIDKDKAKIDLIIQEMEKDCSFPNRRTRLITYEGLLSKKITEILDFF